MGAFDEEIWLDEYGKPFEPTEPSDLAERRPDTVPERQVDLGPFLDGTYVPPQPSVGGERDAGAARLLYPGRWHTLIAPTASGKSWMALWHIVAEIRAGHTIAYAHFEESSPAGTLERLLAVAPELTHDQIRKQFVWLDCSWRWSREQWQLALPPEPSLVILDGINAACGQHGWLVDKTEAVGEYRSLFVTPAIKRGAGVLSLGHPPKSTDRQNERHGFGSTAWLDEVDGVGFRMRVAANNPIRRGLHGWSSVYVVKDRYGQVEALGRVETSGGSEGWYYLGALHIDAGDTRPNIVLSMSSPSPEGVAPKSRLDRLAEQIVDTLTRMDGHTFDSANDLRQRMRAEGLTVKNDDLAPALELLSMRGLVDWPKVDGQRRPRPGSLSPLGLSEWRRVHGDDTDAPEEDDDPAPDGPEVPPAGEG